MVMAAPSGMVIWEANDRTTKGVAGGLGNGGDEGGPGRGAWGSVSRVETASLSLVIARHVLVAGVREACRLVEGGRGERCDPLARSGSGSGVGCRRGGPEFGGAAAGEGALPLSAAGGGERGECLLDAVGGEVALAEVADLGAGESVG
jgi:hypothetical protein